MTVEVIKVTAVELTDLISRDRALMLADEDRQIMNRAVANSSVLWIGVINDCIVAYWGLIAPSLLSERAYLWLKTTSNLHDNVFLFIRHSQRVISEALDHYPLIVGHCLTTNRRARRWLEWLGAKFDSPDGPAVTFTIRRPT
jgi:hypothetical protein